MKFRDNRAGFDTVMFTGQSDDGDLCLDIHYRTPKLHALIELSREDAAALGAHLLEEFSLSKGSARRRLDDELGGVKYAGQLAAVGVQGVAESLGVGPWAARISDGLSSWPAHLPNMAEPVVRRPWWKFWGK